MRRLVTADIHISKNPIDAYRLAFLKENLPVLVDKYKPNELLVLGDITQEKDQHPASLVNEVVGAFHNLAKRCKVIILQGNHDASAVEYPFFEFLNYIDNIQWIRTPTEEANCLYLPHTRDHKKDWQGLSFEDRDFIFAHNTFTGAKVNGQTLSGIPATVFPDDACVLSGDIHEPQTLGSVTYIGSPYAVNFGDDFPFRVLLLDDLEVKSIKVRGTQKRLIKAVVE
jgi:predicted phosphodiesterase